MGMKELYQLGGQRGFVTRSDVTAEEIRQDAFTKQAHRLGWARNHRGQWIPPGVELDDRTQIDAAVEVVGKPVLVTGLSALLLDGIVPKPGTAVELVMPGGRHVMPREGVCIHRTTTFDTIRFHHRGEFAVAACERALADAAEHVGLNDLCQHIATCVRLRVMPLKAIGTELAARRRFPGRARLRTAYGLVTGKLVHSGSERLARRRLQGCEPAPHRRPLTVEESGRLLAEIDIAWPDLFYGVEIDGPHHLLADVAAADRIRDRQLEGIGWKIDRFFWFEVEDRADWFVAEVTRGLVARRKTHGPN